MSANEESVPLKVKITRQLKKFDGDAPKEGEEKEPVEVIEFEEEIEMTAEEFNEFKKGLPNGAN